MIQAAADKRFSPNIFSMLACPCCGAPLEMIDSISLVCSTVDCYGQQHPFELVNGQPLLIDFRSSVFRKQDFLGTKHGEVVVRKKGFISRQIKRFLWGDSPVSATQVDQLLKHLHGLGRPANVLIVGGGTIGLGTEALYHNPAVNLVSFDVYITANTHFIADAHSIPIASGSIDAVIVQAVLEHVLDPAKVVAEIYRVLQPAGLVYAETPFMQQVHEAAYDFTRFTESGHRWLFRNFELVGSGAVRGVGVSLIWSVRYFFAGLFRSNAIGTIAAAAFFWLRWVEKLVPGKANIDGGSCFYFLGRKCRTQLQEKEIVDFYGRS